MIKQQPKDYNGENISFMTDASTVMIGTETLVTKAQEWDTQNGGNVNNIYVSNFTTGVPTSYNGKTETSLSKCTVANQINENSYVKVIIPQEYKCKLYFYVNAHNSSATDTTEWLEVGSVIYVPNDARHINFRVEVKRVDGENCDISDGQLVLVYTDRSAVDLINGEWSQLITANDKHYGYQVGDNPWYTHISNNSIIAHISDLHADYERTRQFFNFCSVLNIPCVNTGDTVNTTLDDSTGFVAKAYSKNLNKIPYIPAVGNHDAVKNLGSTKTTQEELYQKLFADFVGYNDYRIDESTLLASAHKSYCYLDIPAQKLRVISLDLYEGGAGWNQIALSTTQKNFFCASLLNTPANYGIVVLFHRVLRHPSARPQTNNTFFQNPWSSSESYISIGVHEIIDAFIGGQTYSGFNFANKNTGVEFICFMSGHHHRDMIAEVPSTTHKQVMCNITCGCAYDTELSASSEFANYIDDLPRKYWTTSESAFNVYCIDRTSGIITVVRIGSNVTRKGEERKVMTIPYR